MTRTLTLSTVFVYITLLLLVISVSSVLSLFELGGAIDRILRENMDSVLAAESMESSLNKLHFFLLSHENSVEQDLKNLKKEIELLDHDFIEAYHKARSNITIAEEGEIIERIYGFYSQYMNAIDSQVLSTDGSRKAVYQMDHMTQYQDILGEIENLLVINHMAIVSADNRARILARQRSAWMLFLTFVGFVSAFYLNRVVRRRFVAPLNDFILVLRRINLGNADLRLHRGNGEYAELADLINTLVEKLVRDENRFKDYALDRRDVAAGLVEHFPHPTFVFDVRGQVALSNAKARAILLHPRGSDLLRRIREDLDDHRERNLTFDESAYSQIVHRLLTEDQREIGSLVILKPLKESPV